jgi:hypothetical protein
MGVENQQKGKCVSVNEIYGLRGLTMGWSDRCRIVDGVNNEGINVIRGRCDEWRGGFTVIFQMQ